MTIQNIVLTLLEAGIHSLITTTTVVLHPITLSDVRCHHNIVPIEFAGVESPIHRSPPTPKL